MNTETKKSVWTHGGWATLALALAAPAAWATDDHHRDSLETRLRSFNEVPSIVSPAQGRFKAWADRASGTINYELSFAGLEGNVTMAHIHIGQRGVNGGIMVWLCGTATNPGPAGTPLCPPSGSVGGTISSASVQAVAAQGIAANDFAKFSAAVRAGVAYVNVHSTRYPGGELRGQLRSDD